MYSGGVAGAVFSQIEIPETVVILGVNHRGVGAPVALTASGSWNMPSGAVPINTDLSAAFMRVATSAVRIQDDARAHAVEHSIEVQVPFLQFLRPDVSIVPVGFSNLTYDACRDMATALVQGIGDYGKEVLIVASTDMTHYESQEAARVKDELAIERILSLDARGLYETVAQHRISMCGVIPTTIALEASNMMGAGKAELIKYATSGDVTGDYSQVVGYAGFVIY
jgi:AmmeMemoRadiSam system protein B